VFGAWVVGLVAVVGLAITSAGPAEERTTAEASRAAASIAAAEPAGARSISLHQPARRDQVVTTPDIVVRGEAGTDVTRIRVTLESRGNKILASEWIDRTVDAGEAFPFETRFEARMPRPAGVMWVTATALGADGVPMDALRRRFQLGEIRDEPPTATTREVVVRGRVAEVLGDVRIVLEWADGSRVASTPVDPTGHGHGDWVPFEARFRLRIPPSGGAWPSFIVAVDRAGAPIDATRYPFTVRSYVFIPASSGPALAPPARPVLHTTGEDGVMGGIPFGTNFLREP
jgi:hypothetical protein